MDETHLDSPTTEPDIEPSAPLGEQLPLGMLRRSQILDAVTTSTVGWLTCPQLAEQLDIPLPSVRYHVRTLGMNGRLAVAHLRVPGTPGRPQIVAVDIERMYEIDPTVTEPTSGATAEIEFFTVTRPSPSSAPTPPPPPAPAERLLGPISSALSGDHIDHDELARAISEQVSQTIIEDLRLGRVRLVIEAAPPR